MKLRTVKLALEIGAILSALAAAYYWYRSAALSMPNPVAYWDKAPANDPFFMALKQSAHFNQVAAGLTGLSVILSAVRSRL